MSADEPPIDIEAEVIAWLRRQRAARDPARSLKIRGVDGSVVVELPRNGREGEDDPTMNETD